MRALIATVFVLIIVVLFTLMVFVLGIRPPRTVSPGTPADYGHAYERVTLTTSDGLQLTGWFIPNAHSRAVVVIGHGYPYDKGRILPATLFLADSFNLFYFDWRYFGESEGSYTTFGADERKDVQTVMAYLRGRPDVDENRIGLYGVSLSAAIFLQAHPPEARSLVADSPFTSLCDMVRQTYSFLGPVRWPLAWLTCRYGRWFLGRDVTEAAALTEAARVAMPVLFIHGAEDRTVPPELSRRLFEACASEDKTYWLIPGAGHNDTRRIQTEIYENRVRDFFRRTLTGDRIHDHPSH